MWAKIKSVLSALKAGEKVADAIKAKQWTLAVNALGTLAIIGVQTAQLWGALAGFTLAEEQVNSITAGAVALLGLFNHGGTVVSTDKIGITGRTAIQPLAYTDSLDTAVTDKATDAARRPAQTLQDSYDSRGARISEDFDKQRARDSGIG